MRMSATILNNIDTMKLVDTFSPYIFFFCIDEKDPKITISPGVTEKKLKGYFLKNNLCFYSDVIVESVTYGGVVSGGSHVR